MASGSMTSCNIQAFLLQLVVGAPMFNAVLQYLFYVLVKGNCSRQQFNSIEYVAYSLIIVFTKIAAIVRVPMVLKQYTPMSHFCWNNGYPSGCNDSVFGGSDIPSERGHYSQWTGILLFYLIIWCSMIIFIILNVMTVRVLMEFKFSKEAQWVVAQGMMYSSCAFLITWIPSTVATTMSYAGRGGFLFDMIAGIFELLQAFWNMVILLQSNPASVQKLRSILICNICKSSSSSSSKVNTDLEHENNSGKFSAPVSTMFEIEYTDLKSDTMKQESAIVPTSNKR